MDNLISLDSFGVGVAKTALAQRVKTRRLALNLSRKSLAERSGIPESTIKRFETSSDISLAALISLALALGCLEGFDGLFPDIPPRTIREVRTKRRQRGMQ